MALIKDIADLLKHVPLSKTLKLVHVTPSIEAAEIKYIIPEIGQEMYDELDAAYNAEEELSEEYAALLSKVQRALANFAALLYMPIAEVNFSDAGIQRQETDTNKTAFIRQIKNLEESFLKAGYDAIEVLLKFLEANKDDYGTWAESSAYTISKELFINTAEDFNKVVNIGSSRRFFNSVRQTIRKVEEFNVKPVVGDELYEELKEQIETGEVSEENEPLVSLIKKAVAHLTVADSLTSRVATISDYAGLIHPNTGALEFASASEKAASDYVEERIKKETTDGETYIAKLRDYLYKNVDTYPLFKASDAYVEDSKDSFTNEPGDKYYYAG